MSSAKRSVDRSKLFRFVRAGALFDENCLDEAEEAAQKALHVPNPSGRNALFAECTFRPT
jgi:hypothetical protein